MNPNELGLREFYQALARLLSGLNIDSMLVLFVAVVLIAIVIYMIGTTISILFRLFLVAMIVSVAYLIFQYGESISLLNSVQTTLRGWYPWFPDLRILLPGALLVLVLFALYRVLSGND